MNIGIVIDCCSVLLGGLIGSVIKDHLSDSFKTQLTKVLGLSSMGMGVAAIVLMEHMPAVIFALIIGTSIGLIIHLGKLINSGAVMIASGCQNVLGNDTAVLLPRGLELGAVSDRMDVLARVPSSGVPASCKGRSFARKIQCVLCLFRRISRRLEPFRFLFRFRLHLPDLRIRKNGLFRNRVYALVKLGAAFPFCLLHKVQFHAGISDPDPLFGLHFLAF